MVRKVIGYDEKNQVVFERDAREYDQILGGRITRGEIVRAIGLIFIGGMLYANQQNVNSSIVKSMTEVSMSTERNALAISGIKDALWNLNNYLSSSTGKQFKDGRPL